MSGKNVSGGRRAIPAAGILIVLLTSLYLWDLYEERWMPPGPPEVAGSILMERKACLRCHRIGGEGGETGPALTGIALKRTAGWIERFLRAPRDVDPEGRMPRPDLTEEQLAALVAYLGTLNGGAAVSPSR